MTQLAPIDRRAATWGVVGVAVALAVAVLGSGNLRWFDAALVGYLFGDALRDVRRHLPVRASGCGVRRPRCSTGAGWEAFRQPATAPQPGGAAGAGRDPPARAGVHPAAVPGTGGSPTSSCSGDASSPALVTFPLTLGLLHFESVGQNGATATRCTCRQVGTFSFDADSVVGWLIFHALDIAAVLVLAGVFIFLRRRLRDPGRAGRRAQRRLPGAGRAVRGLGHRPVPHRVEPVAGRPLLRGPQHDPRADRDPRPDVHPVREAVPHLPAPRQPRGRLLQARPTPRARQRRAAACGERVRQRRSRSPTSRTCCPRSGSTTRSTAAATTRTPAPRCRRELVALAQSRAGRRVRLMARPPLTEEELIARYGPAPQPGAARGLGRRRRGRPRWSRRTAASAASSAASSSRSTTTRSSGSSPGTSSRSTRASSAPRASSATCRAATPTACSHPLERDPTAPGGFRTMSAGTTRSTASVAEIRRIQASYGDDAFAMLSGVSLDQREDAT